MFPAREDGAANIDRQYSDDEVEFMRAVEEWRRINRDQFPANSELLAIAVAPGYRKTAPPGPMPGQSTTGM